MATFAIQMTDGSVAIMQTVGDATPEDCLAKWQPTQQANVVSHVAIDPATIPQSREFRGAWVLNDKIIDHDLDKAKAIQVARLAQAQIDADQTASDQAAQATAAAAVQATVDAAKSIADLTAIPMATDVAAATTVQVTQPAKLGS